jgi:hypothetical protein
MPAFLLERLENEKQTLPDDMKLGKLIVWAADAANAREVAKGAAKGDSSVAWDNATITDLSTIQSFAAMRLQIKIHSADLALLPDIDADIPMPTGNVIDTVVINDGGSATYIVGEILTVLGGTAVRVCSMRITSVNAGVIDGIELVDPGDNYSGDPSLTANAVVGGSGTVATMDLTLVADDYKNLIGAIVTALNADAQIVGAAMDFGAGANGELNIASGGGGDDLGDLFVTAKFYQAGDLSKTAVPGLFGTLTSLGAAGDVLKVATVASPVAGATIAKL